jgi:hypothetical protein
LRLIFTRDDNCARVETDSWTTPVSRASAKSVSAGEQQFDGPMKIGAVVSQYGGDGGVAGQPDHASIESRLWW